MKKIFITLSIAVLSTFSFAQDSTALAVETGLIKFGQIPTPIGSNLRINGSSWTLEAWVYVPITAGPQQMFVVETYSGGPTGGFLLRINSNYKLMAYQIENPGTSTVVNGTTDVTLGAWKHLAATYNAAAQTLNLFLNGVADGSVPCTQASINLNSNLNIGSRGDDNNIWQTITIDEVRIWEVARTQSQISSSMNSCLAGDETGLLAYYTFEGQTGAVIVDSTSNGNDGTVTNFAPSVLVNGVFDCTLSDVSTDENQISKISVYPNPATSQITVETSETIESVLIYNLAGELVLASNQKIIAVGNLQSGIYLMHIKTENGINQMKLIKE